MAIFDFLLFETLLNGDRESISVGPFVKEDKSSRPPA
jgi:hypothetical protein